MSMGDDVVKLRALYAKGDDVSEAEWAEAEALTHRLAATPEGCLDVIRAAQDALDALPDAEGAAP